ncbi:hypothetical protein HUU51_01320 [Candidatus Gracilibacteria bacterium]|nr:hypothetical protein [Candidatus Gracilibacteria bacterium]
MKKKIKKFFAIEIFLTTFILALLIVLLKFYIPEQYQFIEPISIYGTILSSVIFIYGFILSPSIAEYKESERLLVDIESTLGNIKTDAKYFKLLKDQYDLDSFNLEFSNMLNNFFYYIADDKKSDFLNSFEKLNYLSLTGEKAGITANHIIRMKQELSILKKSFIRVVQIKEKESLPRIIHKLKNFISFIVIVILLLLNMPVTEVDLIGKIEESIMLFLFSFLYIYLSFIITSFDNPFDKRKFSGYLDLSFIKNFASDLITKKD